MPSPIDNTCPTSATSASVPKLAICCLRIAEISAARISIKTPSGNALHRQLQPLQLALNRSVDHARAEFEDEAADQPRVDVNIDRAPTADAAAQLLVQRRELRFAQRVRREHFGGDLAEARGKFGEEVLDHRRDSKKTPIARDHREKIPNQRRKAGPLGERPDPLRLLVA